MDSVAERKRKEKFSQDEIAILVNEVQLHNAKLEHKNTTPKERALIWNAITNKVNAIGVTKRGVTEVKKRWQDVKRRTKEKLSHNLSQARRTGGGPARDDELTPLEKQVETTLQNEQIFGVEGGIDTDDVTAENRELEGRPNSVYLIVAYAECIGMHLVCSVYLTLL